MPQSLRQAAAIPFFEGRICLVTSSSGKRWVIPKGMIDPGDTSGETALKETWEEAGLSGTLRGEPVGSYVYQKYNTLCYVTVYAMDVTEIHDTWPEMNRRDRKWFNANEAIERIEEESLREIIERTVRPISRGKETPVSI